MRHRLLVKSLSVIREVEAFRLCFDRGPVADSKHANRMQMVDVTFFSDAVMFSSVMRRRE